MITIKILTQTFSLRLENVVRIAPHWRIASHKKGSARFPFDVVFNTTFESNASTNISYKIRTFDSFNN